MKLAEKTDVIKHSSAIQTQGKITHLQRRAYNVLLANAYDNLPTQDIHTVGIAELAQTLEFDSKNDDYLKEALTALQGCQVTWNLLRKDGNYKWGVTSLLAHAEIESGVCSYSYSAPLRERLHNPRIYAKINLRLQNKFKSKYGLILWEVCFDYFDEARNEGETPFIPLETFRELAGLEDNKYQKFRDLNYYVIKPAVKEINELTDFLVEVEYQRKSRKVVAVKFIIRKLKKVSQDKPKQGGLFPEYDDMQGVLMELYQAGISSHEALKIYNQGFSTVNAGVRPDGDDWEAYLQEKIDLAKAQDSGKVKNRAGFLRRAIEENWTDGKAESRRETKRKKELRDKISKMEKRINELSEEWAQKSGEITNRIVKENPGIVQDVSADILQQPGNGINLYYNHSESAEQNYERIPIAVQVNLEIRKRNDDQYTPLESEYISKIEAIGDEISKLRASR